MNTNRLALPHDLAARLAAAPTLADLDGQVPDFSTLYPAGSHTCNTDADPDDCLRCRHALGPVEAAIIHFGSEVAHDQFRDTIVYSSHSELTADFGFEIWLPAPVLTYLDHLNETGAGEWLEQFAATIDIVGARLAVGEIPYPRSTAETMALRIAIDTGTAWVNDDDGDFPQIHPNYTLDDLTSATGNICELENVLFEDNDIAFLRDPRLAEIASSGHLHPRNWFTPFRDTDPVDVPA